ncbi:MAG: hypothetical protein HY293_10885 [Planctomycetes bacterium]|nr:hypothetical protein [Planctomycetota bacterium]
MIHLLLALMLGAVNDGNPPDPKAGKGKPPPPPAPAPVQEGERPAISPTDLKMLRDSNIFSPRNRKRTFTTGGMKSISKEPRVPAKPKPPVVTGIFYDAKAESYLVVVEDRNTGDLRQFKDPKFLKTGDEVGGYKIGAVTAEQAAFIKGDLSRDLKVGESLPGPDGKPVSVAPAETSEDPEAAAPPVEGEEKVEIKPLDAESNKAALEKLKSRVGKKNRPSKDE